MYYDRHLSHQVEGSGPFIPDGIYFVRLSTPLGSGHETYHVSWADPIHQGENGELWETRLPSSKFIPTPLVRDLRQLRADCKINTIKKAASVTESHELHMVANYEVQNIIGKALLIEYLSKHLKVHIPSLTEWIIRLLDHAEILQGEGIWGPESQEAIDFLRKEFNVSETLKDAINDQSADGKLMEQFEALLGFTSSSKVIPITGESSSSILQTPKRALKPAINQPLVYVDAKIVEREAQGFRGIMGKMLAKKPLVSIRFLNMSTKQSKKIAEQLSSIDPKDLKERKWQYEDDPSPVYKSGGGITSPFAGKASLVKVLPETISSSSDPLLPIYVDIKGDSELAAENIIKKLRQHQQYHLCLLNWPHIQTGTYYNKPKFSPDWTIANRLREKIKELPEGSSLTLKDLSRISNYTSEPHEENIPSVLEKFEIYALKIEPKLRGLDVPLMSSPPLLKQNVESPAGSSTPSIRLLSNTRKSLVSDISSMCEELSMEQTQELLQILQLKVQGNKPKTEPSNFRQPNFEEGDDEMEKWLLDIKSLMNWEYNEQNIANLIKCNITADIQRLLLGDDGLVKVTDETTPIENITHCFGTRYILPPCSLGNLEAALRSFCKTSFADTKPTEILVPYNPGGHWTILRIRAGDRIKLEYIESIYHDNIEIDQPIKDQAFKLLEGLRSIFLEELFKGFDIDIPDHLTFLRIQNDNKACGPIVIENIKDIIKNEDLPSNIQLSHDEVLNLRRTQESQLKSIGQGLGGASLCVL